MIRLPAVLRIQLASWLDGSDVVRLLRVSHGVAQTLRASALLWQRLLTRDFAALRRPSEEPAQAAEASVWMQHYGACWERMHRLCTRQVGLLRHLRRRPTVFALHETLLIVADELDGRPGAVTVFELATLRSVAVWHLHSRPICGLWLVDGPAAGTTRLVVQLAAPASGITVDMDENGDTCVAVWRLARGLDHQPWSWREWALAAPSVGLGSAAFLHNDDATLALVTDSAVHRWRLGDGRHTRTALRGASRCHAAQWARRRNCLVLHYPGGPPQQVDLRPDALQSADDAANKPHALPDDWSLVLARPPRHVASVLPPYLATLGRVSPQPRSDSQILALSDGLSTLCCGALELDDPFVAPPRSGWYALDARYLVLARQSTILIADFGPPGPLVFTVPLAMVRDELSSYHPKQRQRRCVIC